MVKSQSFEFYFDNWSKSGRFLTAGGIANPSALLHIPFAGENYPLLPCVH
jgi:hypothetical protein